MKMSAAVCLRRAVMMLWLAALPAATRVLAQEDLAITAIKFTGNATLTASTLQEQMRTFATPQWRRTWLRKKPFLFSDETLREDLQRLKRFYQTEGFLHVRIEAPILTVDADRTMQITIPLNEGEPVRVRGREHRCETETPEGEAFAQAALAKLRPAFALQHRVPGPSPPHRPAARR